MVVDDVELACIECERSMVCGDDVNLTGLDASLDASMMNDSTSSTQSTAEDIDP